MFLLYIEAFFGVFGQLFVFPLGTFLVVGAAAAGLGIANELRWGWTLGVVVSALGLLPFAFAVLSDGIGALLSFGVLINLIFPVAQLALLIHPQSREHQKIWFH